MTNFRAVVVIALLALVALAGLMLVEMVEIHSEAVRIRQPLERAWPPSADTDWEHGR